MVKIAITGGIACGKSLVGRFLTERGVAVCEADALARRALRKGSPVFKKVVEHFGPPVVGADGAIDRRNLGQRVFSNATERQVLEQLVHPAVRRAWKRWLKNREGKAEPAAVIVPLLFEIGEQQGWDAVVAVVAGEPTQLRRLRERGFSKQEALRRIRAQMANGLKSQLADFVIFNDGSESVLKEQTGRVLRRILEKKHGTKRRQ